MNKQKQKQTNKSKQVKTLAKQMKKMKLPKSTPFADVGSTLGKSVGKLFGTDLSAAGRWLGSGIGSIFGSGDYEVVGPSPKYNVLSGSIPKFSTTATTNVVTHREYLGDITGTAAFNNIQYALNPGVSATFPWLSQIAPNYQQYRFHGLAFEFNSLITDYVTSGAPGVVVLATNYNADVPLYTTRQEMENSEYAVSRKPTVNMMHLIECDVAETMIPIKNIRNSAPPSSQDLRLYDLGNTQFATQNNPVQDLGELWVTYVVEFLKPVIQTSAPTYGLHMSFTNASASNPFGTTSYVFPTSQLVPSIQGANEQTLSISNALPGQGYQLLIIWSNTSAYAYTAPTITFTGCHALQSLGGTVPGLPTLSNQVIPAGGGTTFNSLEYQTVVADSSTLTFTLGLSGVISSSSASTGDIYLTPIPASEF